MEEKQIQRGGERSTDGGERWTKMRKRGQEDGFRGDGEIQRMDGGKRGVIIVSEGEEFSHPSARRK